MTTDWTPARLSSLRAFCDCIFPSLQVSPDPHGFWARKASDFGVDVAAAATLDQAVPESVRAGLVGLIDALAAQGIANLPPVAIEQVLAAVAASSPDAALGVLGLTRLVLSLSYVLPDAQGKNPNWPAISYPGPRGAGVAGERRIRPLEVDRDELTLEADVCIVGSGAGGGVIAGELARRGLRVVVLEAGAYYSEGDFSQLELWAYQNLYWRGGYTPTADNTVSVISGATLGGGTTVNWQNCVRTPPWVREQWAREYRIDGLDSSLFDKQLDSVLERIHANDHCSDLNGPHQKLQAGAQKLGYAFKRCMLNVDPAKYDKEVAGFAGFGDVTGSRMSTLNTYLEDAFRSGARILVRTRANRILTSHGRATGVLATATGSDGKRRTVRVQAPHVVAACGALETPALLKRSAIGGPATGNYLHLHPTAVVSGVYSEDQRAWWGPAQSGLSDACLRLDDDHGALFECAHHSLMTAAAGGPWQSGRAHKELMSEVNRYATFIAIVRDRGHGRVEIDQDGESVPFYPVQDPFDIAHVQRGIRELANLHRAAGAERIVAVANNVMHTFREGDDFEQFVTAIAGPRGQLAALQLFSAHQMGTARMGTDPNTSAAKPTGELHDVRGVWIGDTSAFPTALGVNPMITCMALAARTASMIADQF